MLSLIICLLLIFNNKLLPIFALPFRSSGPGSILANSASMEFVDNTDLDYGCVLDVRGNELYTVPYKGIVHIFHEKKPEGESSTDRPFTAFGYPPGNGNSNNKHETHHVNMIRGLTNLLFEHLAHN